LTGRGSKSARRIGPPEYATEFKLARLFKSVAVNFRPSRAVSGEF